METMGARIKRLREARRWSQKDLADAANISQVTITHLEAGRNRSSKFLLAIAAALDIDPRELERADPNANVEPIPNRYSEGARKIIQRIQMLDEAHRIDAKVVKLVSAALDMAESATPTMGFTATPATTNVPSQESIYRKQAIKDNKENLKDFAHTTLAKVAASRKKAPKQEPAKRTKNK